ncbi:MAG: hypothetical protein LUH07_14210 [Lachnospiraceae bacterium]|nr:hypothetical protein [Lachnospiraceae bacterium]
MTTKEEIRMDRISRMVLPIVAMTVYGVLIVLFWDGVNRLPEAVQMVLAGIMVIADIGLVLYCGAIPYLLKFIATPMKLIKYLGFVGIFPAFILFFAAAWLAIYGCFVAPGLVFLYEWFCCSKKVAVGVEERETYLAD